MKAVKERPSITKMNYAGTPKDFTVRVCQIQTKDFEEENGGDKKQPFVIFSNEKLLNITALKLFW